MDGAEVPVTTVARAWHGGRDVTEELRRLGLEADSFPRGAMRVEDVEAFWQARETVQIAALAAAGLLLDLGTGPSWTVRKTHAWRQRFPPGRPVTIRYAFAPVLGWEEMPSRARAEAECFDPGRAREVYWATVQLPQRGNPRSRVPRFEVVVKHPTSFRAGFCFDGPIDRSLVTILRAKAAPFEATKDLSVYFAPK